MRLGWLWASVAFAAAGTGVACSSATSGSSGFSGSSGTSGTAAGGSGGTLATGGSTAGGSGGAGGTLATGGSSSGGAGGSGPSVDPTTCAEAEAARSYLGCDFWPTVTANIVWEEFDFAVVVANTGASDAHVTVTSGGTPVPGADVVVAANGLQTIYLPWVAQLKGDAANNCGSASLNTSSSLVAAGAFHLESDRPVTVYQFNALEYKGQGGRPGKNWATCSGNTPCSDPTSGNYGAVVGCFSFSNDASLLLPSTAMTGNYRLAGMRDGAVGSFATVTATADGTTVHYTGSVNAPVLAGNGVSAGTTGVYTMNRGDVLQLMVQADTSGLQNRDFSGGLVQADKPVQVITGSRCITVPQGVPACDHIEESVLPAETLGKHYIVTVPTAPKGTPVGHVVRVYGNTGATTFTYPGYRPPNAPNGINAGQVVDLGQVNRDFEIVGDHEFMVGSFQLGGQTVAPLTGNGDPAQSFPVTVEQWRTKYVFLAPNDYEASYADIVLPAGATATLDGQAVPAGTAISSGYTVSRVKLSSSGVHLLQSASQVGLQVLGYGSYTSYQYPGGLNLGLIAPPPPPPA